MKSLLVYPYLQVSLHEGPQPVLELQWQQYASSTEFRAAMTLALQFSLAHRVRGWVADDRLQGAIRPRDLEWAEQHILGPLDTAGLQRLAQLESQDALNRRTVDLLYTRTMPTLHIAVRRFEDLALARRWAAGS